MKIESLFLLSFYLIPLIAMGIISHINYKNAAFNSQQSAKAFGFKESTKC